MDPIIIIPARYASTRFPGKPLALIGDKPMLQHVYERALAANAGRVIIATDDPRIEAAARGFSAEVCMTSANHTSGTERISEVIDHYAMPDDTVVVNLQGDEPFIPPSLLDQVGHLLQQHPGCGMATLAHPVAQERDLFDANVVKVIIDARGRALYFSRAPIPWHRESFPQQQCSLEGDHPYLRHIGLYAYTAGFLRRYRDMAPCVLERVECLEQLRVLWHGECIQVGITCDTPGIGIDTPADLEQANRLYATRPE